MSYKEYTVTTVKIDRFFTSGLVLKKLEPVLNDFANNGWSLVSQVVVSKRWLLIFSRKALLLTFGR